MIRLDLRSIVLVVLLGIQLCIATHFSTLTERGQGPRYFAEK